MDWVVGVCVCGGRAVQKQRSSERECDLSRGSRFTAKTLGLSVLQREVTDILRYVNTVRSVHWSDCSGSHTLSTPRAHKSTHRRLQDF